MEEWRDGQRMEGRWDDKVEGWQVVLGSLER